MLSKFITKKRCFFVVFFHHKTFSKKKSKYDFFSIEWHDFSSTKKKEQKSWNLVEQCSMHSNFQQQYKETLKFNFGKGNQKIKK